MRQQWRLLLRHNLVSTPRISGPLFLHQVTVTPSTSSTAAVVSSSSTLNYPTFTPIFQPFYSSVSSSSTSKFPETSIIIGIFSKLLNHDEIKKELDDNNVVIDNNNNVDLINEVLQHLESESSIAITFFKWVSDNGVLDSNSYNLMLGILGRKRYVKEIWKFFALMVKEGFGMKFKKGVFDCVINRIEIDGLGRDLRIQHHLFLMESLVDTITSRVVRRDVRVETLEKILKSFCVQCLSKSVKMALQELALEPDKGLRFFRWVEETGVYTHDQATYNTMAIVLGREDCVDRFWSVVRDMRNAGYELKMRTYVEVLGRFIDRKMMKDAVGLYEFMMDGENKPSRQECTFLLRKLAVAKELDMELFSRVVKAFTGKGFALEDSMLDSVLKSLTSVGRMKECNKVLDAMVEVGFVPSGSMKARVAYDLTSSELKDEAEESMETLEGHGLTPNYETWSSAIGLVLLKHGVAFGSHEAVDCFEKMIENEGCHVEYAFDMIVNVYCDRSCPDLACKMLLDVVNKKSNFEPWHDTYKTLITKLLCMGHFQNALPLLVLMKRHGFPPFVDPFITYILKKGSPKQAMKFLKEMTRNSYPSTNIFLQVFEAYSKAGRHKDAQYLLAECPNDIQNHADVLNLFSCMKTEKPAETKLASVGCGRSGCLGYITCNDFLDHFPKNRTPSDPYQM